MSKKKDSKRNKKDLRTESNLDAKLRAEFGERIGDEQIIEKNVADCAEEYTKIFGANKNLYRTIASMIDGVKPGMRRLLYSWWELENCPTNTRTETLNKLKFYKVDKLSSDTTGNYHPHGSTAIEETVGKAGQTWSNNAMLLVPQGSFGNIRGDKPAAGRYIEAKLSEYTIDCFFSDFDNYCVPMRPSYNGRTMEPEYLPAKYPHVLFNPQFSGIGVGMASNIPPFNIGEVLDATIKLIKDPTANIMLIPDSPTGCDIVDNGLLKQINKTGIGKIVMRASTEIDYVNNVIIINSLPYNVSSNTDVIQGIIDLQNKEKAKSGKGKKVKFDIEEIKDYTQNGDVRIELYLSKDSKPEKVLDKLYKKNIGLKKTQAVGITVIDDFVAYEYGVKDLLLAWIDYRFDAVLSMLLNKLQNKIAAQHINEVLVMIFDKNEIEDRINEIIAISRKTKTLQDTIEALMKKFKITSAQARTIAMMRVHNFNKDSYDKYVEDEKSLEKEIQEIEDIISDDEKLKEYIIKELEEGKKKYAVPRKSKVVKESDKGSKNIPDTEHLIGISESGYIKKIPLKGNTSIGKVGKDNSALTVLPLNNRENLLVIDSKGNVVKISVSAIPDMEYEDFGIELKKFFSVKGDIKAVMELPSMDVLKVEDESMSILFVTKQGLAKKVQISEFKKITDVKPGISLNKDDEVASAAFLFNDSAKDIILSTNKGDGVRLPLDEIRSATCNAKGVSMITLSEGEEVVGSSLVNPKKKLLFYLTSQGRAKVTELKYFPVMKRKDSALSLINLVGTETLLGVSTVDKNDVIMIYKKTGEPEKILIKDLEIGTRISKGERIITPKRGDSIVAYKVFTE